MKGRARYYLRKPKGEIVKDILLCLAVGGAVAIAATSPYFARQLLSNWNKRKRYKSWSVETAFQRLRKNGSLVVERKGHIYHVSLTGEGRRKAGWLQIDALHIPKPKKWDGKWRLLMFDIAQFQRWKRDVLRSFLRRLGFLQFQKSVWIHPYNCKAEVDLLKELLGLTAKEIKLVLVESVGEDSSLLMKAFHLP